MDSNKILIMIVENMYFLDSLNFLPMSLKSMLKSFHFSRKKDYYPHILIGREFGIYGPLS